MAESRSELAEVLLSSEVHHLLPFDRLMGKMKITECSK